MSVTIDLGMQTCVPGEALGWHIMRHTARTPSTHYTRASLIVHNVTWCETPWSRYAGAEYLSDSIGEARRDEPEVNVTSNLLVQTKIPQNSLGNQDLHIQLVSFQRK